MNRHANPPNNEFPPPTPSLLNKAWANRGNPLILSATSYIHDVDSSGVVNRKETYAPKDDLNKSFNVNTDANSSGYESER